MTEQDMRTCITLCWECRDTCQKALYDHCLIMGGDHAAAEHVKIMTDCIQACQTCADFMTRQSHMHSVMCLACADVCNACAASCQAIGDDRMLICARACRRCAESCRKMSHAMVVA